MVPEFAVIPIEEITADEFDSYNHNADMVRAFIKLEPGTAIKIETDKKTVKQIPEYAVLQNAAQRRDISVRSRIMDGHLYMWHHAKESKS